MNPLLATSIIAAGCIATVLVIQYIVKDGDVQAGLDGILCIILAAYCIIMAITALMMCDSYVSVKLWNQQHNTNYSATEWFYAECVIRGDKQ